MQSRPGCSVRQWWVLFHRWVGLVLAGFLLLSGLTGSLLAWDRELDGWLASSVLHDPAYRDPVSTPAKFDALALRDIVVKTYPDVRANYVELQKIEPGATLQFFIMPSDPKSGPLENDQVFLSPIDGRIVGMRKYAAISQGWKNFMPFIYSLHDQLALGAVGTTVFGIVALLWTLDCFVGAYLTFPLRIKRRKSEAPAKSWWARWKPSWRVRWRAGGYKLNFDLHRAGGLWAWAMLFVFAWSGVSFNLASVYNPVMKTAFTFDEREAKLPVLAAARREPVIGWHEAYRIGQTLMASQAQRFGVKVEGETMLSYDAFHGMYRYTVKTTADIGRHGGTHIDFDADSGVLQLTSLPTGQYGGDTVTNWFAALHMAQVWGWPFRVIVSVLGLTVAMLSMTGVVICWKKVRARRS